MLALIAVCLAASSWPVSDAIGNSMQQPPFSASMLYVYAKDSVEWAGLTGRQLRPNDTLLIRPGVFYKVWCEVLPEGWPQIRSSLPGVIAYQPRPLNTMAHVELEGDLISTLKVLEADSKSAKLWCDYRRGDEKLRIQVSLKPLIIANTTCDFSTASGLVIDGLSRNFTCTSTSGYPRPEHHCDIVRNGGASRQAAQVVSVFKTDSVSTIFSVPANRGNQNASIECSVQQKITFGSFAESFKQKVGVSGPIRFTFASESVKRCIQILKGGDLRVVVECQSEGGHPDTEHRCWKTNKVKEREVTPLMAKIQDATYITELAFNNSWTDQGGSVTCVLQQGTFYEKRFSFEIPAFRRAVKKCQFSQLKSGQLEAKCITGSALPPSKHGCELHWNGTGAALVSNQTTVHNGSRMSLFYVSPKQLNPGSRVVCTLSQDGFDPAVFVHTVPQFTESRKNCRFANSPWEVRVTCEFGSGHPITRSDCQLMVANSSVRLTLQSEKENDSQEHLSRNVYSVRLPGPNASHAGGSVLCRVHQDAMFVKTFVYRFPEYRGRSFHSKTEPNATEAEVEPELRISNQTVLTLSLALAVALLLVLLLSLPIPALRRCLGGRKRTSRGGDPSMAELTGQLTQSSAEPLMQQPTADLYEIVNLRHGGYRRRDHMPDIDQTSMFECGYAANLSNANKRKSVLADALVLCQADLDRRDNRFSI